MKITREGTSLIALGALIPSDDVPEGGTPPPDCCDVGADPIDRGSDGSAVRISEPGTASLVQAVAAGNSGADGGGQTATLPSTPAAGNILIAIVGNRDIVWAIPPTGYTELVANAFDASPVSHRHQILAKVSDGTDGTITFSNAGNAWPESLIFSEWAGFDGVLPTVDTSATSDITDDATPDVPAVTPTASTPILLIASNWKQPANPNPGPQTLSGYTLIDDTGYAGFGNRHRLTAWYQWVASTSGTYGPTTISDSSDATDDSNIIHVALAGAGSYGSAWVIPSPNVTDGDDATYDTVTSNTELLRIDLGAPFRITSTRIRIAANTSGARMFTIKGANAADFSDEVTLATIAFTATGSYTAQDVTGSWSTTESYRYFELTIGTSDTYRIHAWELFEGTLVGDVTAISDALDAHLVDTVDAHDASAVSIADAGGYYTGTDVEAALQELGAGTAGSFVTTNEGGGEDISTVAAAGATETLDLTDGNVHDVTLTADCTFTFAAVAAGAARSFTLVLRQDGTGGWDPTWPGSVVWPGGAAPTLDTTASSVSVLTFFTLDGGSIWYGFPTGGSGATFATPAIVLGTAAAAGAASTVIRSDATIVAFDATVPVTQAFGDSAATGSAAVAARRDHKHGMPATPTGGGIGPILISDSPSTPLVFADLLQNEAQDDLIYADP